MSQAAETVQVSDRWSQGLTTSHAGSGAHGCDASALEVNISQSGNDLLSSLGGSRASLSSMASSSPWPADNTGAPRALGTISSDLYDRMPDQTFLSANPGRERGQQTKSVNAKAATKRIKGDGHGEGIPSTGALVQRTDSRFLAAQQRPPPSLIQYRRMHQQLLRHTG